MKLPANKPNFSCFNFASFMPSKIIFSLIVSFLLWSCGGDEPPVEDGAELGSAETESTNEVSNLDLEDAPAPEPFEQIEEDPEPGEIPDPNGVFLPIYEDNDGKMEMVKMNDQPVYTNGEGYFYGPTDPSGKLPLNPVPDGRSPRVGKPWWVLGQTEQMLAILQMKSMPSRQCSDWQ